MPPVNTTFIFFGCLGGLLPDVLRLINNRHNKATPVYLRKVTFWVGLILLMAIGGFTAWLAGASEVKAAIAYGFGAPELLSRLVATPQTSQVPADRGNVDFSLRDWWAR